MTPSNAESEEFYEPPAYGWTCYHCGENFPATFAGQRAAAEHFGAPVDGIPGCRLRMRKGEISLLRRIRWLERQLIEKEKGLARYREEVSDKDREIHAMQADHALALRREEEKGYARGLRDGREPSI